MPHIKLEGIYNLRDLGGYATADGGVVRTGCLFRSDELHALTEKDHEVVAALGIRVLFDLRNNQERQEKPNPSLRDVVVHERDAAPHPTAANSFENQIRTGIAPQADDDEFGNVYVMLLSYLGNELRRIIELASTADEAPLLFHCVAGKDRTGLTAAILLGLLGVSDETILDDYELTTELWTPNRMRELTEMIAEHEADPEMVLRMISARRPVLARAIQHIRDTWGTYENFVTDELGVAPETVAQLRERLLA